MPSWWPVNFWPFCRHRSSPMIREVHGDERRYAASWWECNTCGVQRASLTLDSPFYTPILRAAVDL
jgi:hypothetical protein